MDKVFTVVGLVAYENEDVLGIYTSKDDAIAAGMKIAQRPVDYYAEYVNYDRVEVYAVPLNTAMERMRDMVWADDCEKREYKAKAS